MKTFALPAVLAALMAIAPYPAFSQNQDQDQVQDRDEFGLKPEAPHDDELVLPDPVLDRSWPMPEPGVGSSPPPIAPDEDDVDPFAEETERPAEPSPDDEDEDEEGEFGFIPPPPVARKPAPEPDPFAEAILEPEIDDPAGLEDYDEPSPLDLDEQRFRDEAKDGDW